MKQYLTWQVAKSADGKTFEKFIPAAVPGNVQFDYAAANGFADDWYVGDNFHKFDGLEDNFWKYRTILPEIPKNETAYFVALGIDYEFDIFLNGKRIYSHEGMFSKTDLRLDDAKEGDVLEVLVHPAPKNPVENGDMLDQSRIPLARSEADRSAKPAVCYGWDFHPRLIVQGIWDEAYIETKSEKRFLSVTVDYEVEEILDEKGKVRLAFSCETTGGKAEYALYDKKNDLVMQTAENSAVITAALWFPHTLGKQPLYTLVASLKDETGAITDTYTKKIGFRKVELLMNEGAWNYPSQYPLTRSACPFTLCVNGKKTFAKGSNFVNIDVFVGRVTEEDYRQQLQLVKECNMNIVRLWGGAVVNKQAFFDICDELGVMVWQEFPLACNNYVDDKHYLQIIEQEAKAIVAKIKDHPCHVLWCGGNELFNCWSLMTDQSLVLRTLNKICLDYDPYTPFLPTSPVMGVTHGPYRFSLRGQDVFHLFNDSISTGYTEFGVPSMASYEQLKKFIPAEELDCFKNTKMWQAHNAFDRLGETVGHCDLASVTKYFGETTDTKTYIEYSQFLAATGYTYIFEEARRQPMCSMAINWCFNEPWYCASNNSLISYGNVKKKAYAAVQNALSPVTPSLRMKKFDYSLDENAVFELHVLNDSGKESGIDRVDVYLDYGDKIKELTTLYGKSSAKNEYFGTFGFTVDKEMYDAAGCFSLPTKNTLLHIVLKANGIEKRYPVMIMKK